MGSEAPGVPTKFPGSGAALIPSEEKLKIKGLIKNTGEAYKILVAVVNFFLTLRVTGWGAI